MNSKIVQIVQAIEIELQLLRQYPTNQLIYLYDIHPQLDC